MAQINNLVATTELEAVNAMLSGIGEAPVSNVDTAVAALQDVAMAVNILRNTAREVQRRGWEYNTEPGFTLTPAVSNFAWTDPDGTALSVNIFKPPVNLVRFGVTGTSLQLGSGIDLVVRPSRVYQEATKPVLVFYDRSRNRDGLDASKFATLQIDPIWLFDFEQCPESVRAYVTVVAARRFAQEMVGSQERSAFKHDDERRAAVELFRDQSPDTEENMFDEPTVATILGVRPRFTSPAVFDIRYNP